MKNCSALLIAAFVFAAVQSSFAQSWSKAQEVEPNYYAIRQQFLDHWKGRKPGKGQGYKVFKRWEHHWESRIMPDGTFPPSNINETEWNNYLASLPEASKGKSAANWTSMGPNTSNSGYNGIGRINSIAVDPNNPNVIWVGTPAGGLWKTENGGDSWTTNTDDLAVLGVSAILINPFNTDTMYIGTGDAFGGDTRSRGVLKSTDGGVTWNTTGLTWNVANNYLIRAMVMHPANPDIIMVAASNGFFRTTNGGANWTEISDDDFDDVKFNPTDPNIIYAASNNDLFVSTNAGVSLKKVLTVENSDRLAIAVTPADPSMVAVVSSSNGFGGFGAYNGLYVSKDTGNTYVLKSTEPNLLDWSTDGSDTGGQGWYDLCIAVSPTDADMIFVGAVNLWKSEDGGATWALNTYWYDPGDGTPVVHADKHALRWSGNTLFNGCDGGIYKTEDDGATWIDISSNLTISQMYRLGVSQSDNKVICGLQDNGTKLRSNIGFWTDNIGGDGMECFIHPTDSDIMFGEYQYGNIHRSTNGGMYWENIHWNIPDEPQGAWITPFVMDPNNSSTIYVGYRHLYKSTDLGDSWEQVTPPDFEPFFDLRHIAVAPSSSDTIWISDGDQVYRSTDAGLTWNNVTWFLPTANQLTYLTVDPDDANTAYVTYGGYAAGSKIYRTVNGGTNWQNLSATLPNLPANCVIVEPNTGVLYLGMDVGVYRREPGATGWEPFNTGLPNVIVNELEIRHSTGKIRAATYGRGLWESDLAPFVPALSVNPAILNYTASGGQQNFSVNGNCDWTATNVPSWVTLSPSSSTAGPKLVKVTVTPNATTDSQAVVITIVGCDGQVTQTLTVTQQGQLVSTDEPGAAARNTITCVPNPAKESVFFVIKTERSQTAHLDILSEDGKVLSSKKNVQLHAGENSIPWLLNDLPAGNYLYRCYFENEIKSGRIVLTR